MESIVKVRVDDYCGSIILNRPQRRNALTRGLIADLQQAFKDLHQERKVRAVILTGSGNSFCAGLDLHELHETAEGEEPEKQWHHDAVAYRDLIQIMLHFPKPIIAAVNGPVLGAGAGVMLAADVVVAADSAEFAIPAPRRGVVAGMVAPLLAFRIGAGPTANIMLTSRAVDSEEALRLGLFHELVHVDMTWVRAQQLAADTARASHEAVSLTKRMINETIGENLMTLLTTGAAVTATSKTTEAAREGIRAFVEKRDPQWP